MANENKALTVEGEALDTVNNDTQLSVASVAEPMEISASVTRALADSLAKIAAYVPINYVDDMEPDINSENLNQNEQALMRVTNLMNSAVDVIKDLQSQVTKLNGDLAATAKSYTPVFTWSNSGTSPTVKNIQVRYSVMAKICFIYARYEITSLGNPGDNDYLKISLPEGIIPVFEPLSMISEYQTNSELPKVLGVRTMPDGYLHVVEGVGGGYSGSYIPTGYQGFSAFFMFK